MPDTEQAARVLVHVEADHSLARLTLRAVPDEPPLSTDEAVEAARAASVEITDSVRHAIEALVAQLDNQEIAEGIIAHATPPRNGRHGHIDWLVRPRHETAPNGDAIDHHLRSPIINVQTGQELGRIVEPTNGAPGRDVTGQEIPATDGQPVEPRLDDSVELNDDGVLVAKKDGALSRSLHRVSVRDALEIEEAVDHATGNIEFAGDVFIAHGVKDRFVVNAAGNLTVGEMIEAAQVECGGDLSARGGMAGRTRGTALVRGDCQARFFDSTELEVYGVLVVEREIINCQIIAHSGLRSPNAAIVGGLLTAGGPVEVGKIGSPAAVPTLVNVGRLPLLEPANDELERLTKALERERRIAEKQLEKLSLPGRIRTPQDTDAQTELNFNIHTLTQKLADAEQAHARVREQLDTHDEVDLLVWKCLHARAEIIDDTKRYTISKDLTGPVRITRDESGELVYRVGSRGVRTPLSVVATIQAAA